MIVENETPRRALELLNRQWLETVLSRKPRIAVFDCDGTLWSKDAGFSFMEWSLEKGLVSRQGSEWLDARYREYLTGTVDEATICGEMVQVYAGLRENELRRAAARFVQEVIAPTVFPVMEELIAALHSMGTELWAVSSTADFIIEAGVVERFGIPPERVLATAVAFEDGLATSTLLAVPTDEAKAEALRKAGVPHPDAVFGNSVHDLAMLEIAKHAYPVSPSEALEEEAEARGWIALWPMGPRLRAHV